MKPPRKLHIKSYGCQMNVYDAQRMTDALAREGFESSDDAQGADLVILNTCHIREKASEKVFSELGRLRATKEEAAREGRALTIAVAGCVAQAEGTEILRRAPVVDIVVGPQSYHRLPELIAQAQGGAQAIDTEFPVNDKFNFLPQPDAREVRARGVSAFVTIQEGCDKFCTFCVVPYTRGMEVSRPVEKIVQDVAHLAQNGVREVTLIGQNVNAYHGEGADGKAWNLGRLMERLARIDGIVRLRYTTSHPNDMDDSLIAAHRDLPALMPYVHLPVQSGSNRILAAMNRKHTREDYLRLIDKMRSARSDLAFTSDFIVGFPGESEGDFADTLDLIGQIGYAGAYSFKYSPRPGTPAAELHESNGSDDAAGPLAIAQDVMDERLARLQSLINRQQAQFATQCVGQTFDVLFERKGRHDGQIIGRSPYLQGVHVYGPAPLIGEVRPVRILETRTNSLAGELVIDEARRDGFSSAHAPVITASQNEADHSSARAASSAPPQTTIAGA